MSGKSLKTSTFQRIVIIAIALLMLGSTIATYIIIVAAGNKSSQNNAELTAAEQAYTAKQTEINEYAKTLSDKYFDTMKPYRSERVRSYNATTANEEGLKKKDLKEGDGRELAEGDTNYFAYYIGWCADESVFDATFDNNDNPTALTTPIYAGVGLVEGWNQGVAGMKINGVRELTIPGELAYGDSREICGGTNSPLKFVVMPIEDAKMTALNSELEDLYGKLIQIYYGSKAAQ